MKKSLSKKQIRTLVLYAVLIAIEAIFCFTPLGSIPIGPLVATLAMIPVCISAVLLGTVFGTVMGFAAGLFSFLVWTFSPPSFMAIAFTPFYPFELNGIQLGGNWCSLIICFIPRILAGTFAALVYKALTSKTDKNALRIIGAALAGITGSVVNTIGVLGGIALFMNKEFTMIYAENAYGATTVAAVIGVTILTNAIPEAVLAGVITPAALPLKKLLDGKVS